MSGHSKWSTIKHKKAAEDAKQGKVFGQIGRQIRVAVKEGGSGDPEQNPSLRVALEKARSANMPKENVERAIERGLGKSRSGATLAEVVYEGYGPGRVGFMVFAVTDNRNRTSAEIRGAFEHSGGTLGGPGSTAYLFSQAQGGLEATVQVPLPVTDTQLMTKVEQLIENLENSEDVEVVVTNMVKDQS
jgi:YebC/PmpR family DNA-binding regulatory protein